MEIRFNDSTFIQYYSGTWFDFDTVFVCTYSNDNNNNRIFKRLIKIG